MVLSKIKMLPVMWGRILRLASRPDTEEYMLLLRLSLIGFTLVGGLGFIIHILYILITGPGN